MNIAAFLSDGTTLVDKMEQYAYLRTPANAAASAIYSVVLAGFINVTVDDTVVKLRYKFAGTGGGALYNAAGDYSKFFATRTA
jgi:hypothetical protein